jgi:membrane fusion protein (multidrug efflux system)
LFFVVTGRAALHLAGDARRRRANWIAGTLRALRGAAHATIAAEDSPVTRSESLSRLRAWRRVLARSVMTAALTAAVTAALVACGAKDTPPAAAGTPPPPEVGVVTVTPQEVALQTELPGRVEAVRIAQVRARVNGIILKRLFREGSEVKAGQLLYEIDAAPYRAALEGAQAALARAQANLAQASAQAERDAPLVQAHAISQQEYVSAQAAQQLAQADVAAGKAAVTTARINLDYTRVGAPIAGRIGRALVTEGALVGQAEGTPLATIQQTSTVYVNFTQSAADVLRLRKALAGRQLRSAGEAAAAVHVVLEDGSELPRAGRLLFSDLTVDATSGQITLRAEVPNADGLLLPGQYVRVRLAQAQAPAAMLLPQQAVMRSSQGDSVLVVGADGVPTPRPVKVGPGRGNQWVVLEGLQPGEKVVADGFQKLRGPGPVKPVPWSAAGAAAAGPASSGARP